MQPPELERPGRRAHVNPFLALGVFFAELIQFLAYFYFFWAFLFSAKFRKKAIRNWRKSGPWDRLNMLLEALISLFVGLLPLWLWLFL